MAGELTRLAQTLAAFRDTPPGQTIAATATADGGAAHLTYGDLFAIYETASAANERLERIASWHSRETADGGMVGDYCNDCGQRWPCETRQMADGTHEDLTAREDVSTP